MWMSLVLPAELCRNKAAQVRSVGLWPVPGLYQKLQGSGAGLAGSLWGPGCSSGRCASSWEGAR